MNALTITRLAQLELGIKQDYMTVVCENRLNCIVPDDWLNNLKHLTQLATAIDPVSYDSDSLILSKLLLSQTSGELSLDRFQHISLVIIEKLDKDVESLVETPFCLGVNRLSHASACAVVEKSRCKCLQKDAEQRYSQAVQLMRKSETHRRCIKDHNLLIREVLCRLYGCSILVLNSALSCNYSNHVQTDRFVPHPGILPAHAIIESDKAFYILQPFVRYTLADLVTFSPSKLKTDFNAAKSFLVYQLLQAVRHLHTLGLSVFNLRLKDLSVNDQMWIQIITLNFSCMYLPCSETVSAMDNEAVFNKNELKSSKPSIDSCYAAPFPFTQLSNCSQMDLSVIVQKWIYREISNFEYLMILNGLAGRNTNEPNHYPILPWIIDFSVPNWKFRDLTKTKYRLNKGDQQLDLTYDITNPESMMRHPSQTPFHVSDFLSDITYYVYKARRTEKSILCKVVRPRWEPNHYPVSLQRLYDWTPDECIPEFYSDPEIFVSIHDDLPDLQLPSWVQSGEEFIELHRQLLEGEYASDNLHHWIDLTFGYKLKGKAAVSSKNVCLQLVDNHKQLLNHGVVQLFSSPHPRRRRPPPCTDSNPQPFHDLTQVPSCNESATQITKDTKSDASLKKNPLEELEHLESVIEFVVKTTNRLPEQRPQLSSNDQLHCEHSDSVVARDMQTVGCLIVELFMSSVWSLAYNDGDLLKRYQLIRQLCQTNARELPLCFRRGLIYLLNLNSDWSIADVDTRLGTVFTYPSLGLDDLPPPTIDMLLQNSFSLLTFSRYFESLYCCLLKLKSSSSGNQYEQLDKVSQLADYLFRMCNILSVDGLGLILPYVEELLNGNDTMAVQSAWSLFFPVSQAIGLTKTTQHLLQPLVNIFDTDQTNVKFLKIYHRSFLNQLIIRFGLETFLNSFSTLLVEAVSGYKNFSSSIEENEKRLEVVEEMTLSCSRPTDECNFGTPFDGNEEFREDSDTTVQLFVEEDAMSVTSEGSLVYVRDDANDVDGSISSEHNVSVSSDSAVVDPSPFIDNRVKSESQTDVDKDRVSTATSERNGVSEDGSNTTRNRFFSTSDGSADYNISNVATESVKWLASRLGPVLTAKHLSRNLLRMLALCYVGTDQLMPVIPEEQDAHFTSNFMPTASNKYIVGDGNASLLLDCLSSIASLYGEQITLIQYIHHVKEMIPTFRTKTLSTKCEGSLISCLVLLRYIIPFISETCVVDIVEETLIKDILLPIMSVISSVKTSFASGSQSRAVACYLMIDVICVICLRIGFEMTRRFMTQTFQMFFAPFSEVHDKTFESVDENPSTSNATVVNEGNDESDVGNEYFELRLNSETNEFSVDVGTPSTRHRRQISLGSMFKHSLSTSPGASNNSNHSKDKISTTVSEPTNVDHIALELSETFNPEMAHTAYIPFCKLAGGIHIEQHLKNDDLIRNLCTLHDQQLMSEQARTANSIQEPEDEEAERGCSLGDNVTVEGNKILVKDISVNSGVIRNHISSLDVLRTAVTSTSDGFKSFDTKKNSNRHLRGNWLAYWEHEVGLSDRSKEFNVKQIKLQTFQGHTNSVRDLYMLDNENSFISASKDHTVKLWSLRNCGDGSEKVGCQSTYSRHKKAVFSVSFIESVRLVASCDGSIHIWDPFNSMTNIRQITPSKTLPVMVMTVLPAPSCTIIAACTDSILRLSDARTGRFVHHLRSTYTQQSGFIRSIAVTPDGQSVAVGYSTGVVSLLDLRTGSLLSTWKAHESEIYEMRAYDNRKLVTCSVDAGMSVWSFGEGKLLSQLKGVTEPSHWINFYKGMLISANSSNRVLVHSSLESNAELVSTKLKSDLIRGVVSSMTVLPLNRLLLFGSDHGDISLIA